MGRAALIIATRETQAADGNVPGELVATLPLLGRTLLEHQVRQAVHAGARHIVLLVERMPAALLAAVDRLRRDGVAIEVARAAADAADRFHPDEAVLLIGDGVIAPQPLLARIAAAAPPALATSDQPPAERTPGDHAPAFERIDATGWWAGLALVDGASVRRTVAMLGEWDAEATLVRRAVQAGALRIDAGPPADRPVRIAAAAALPAIEARLARRTAADTNASPAGWAERLLFAPIAAISARLLAGRRIEPDWLATAAAILGLAAGGAALAGWGWAGLALFAASGPLAATARRLAALRLGALRRPALLERVRHAGGVLVLAGIGIATNMWGWSVMAGAAVLAMLALARERPMLRASGGTAPGWTADADALGWVLLPAAALGGWPGALAVAAGYAAISFGAVQQRLARVISAGIAPDEVGPRA